MPIKVKTKTTTKKLLPTTNPNKSKGKRARSRKDLKPKSPVLVDKVVKEREKVVKVSQSTAPSGAGRETTELPPREANPDLETREASDSQGETIETRS